MTATPLLDLVVLDCPDALALAARNVERFGVGERDRVRTMHGHLGGRKI